MLCFIQIQNEAVWNEGSLEGWYCFVLASVQQGFVGNGGMYIFPWILVGWCGLCYGNGGKTRQKEDWTLL